MSEVNLFEIQQYLDVARGRVTEQFRTEDHPIFDSYLQLLLGGKIELQEVFRQLMQERSLDTATGTQLDILGDIVGQPRELIDTALLTYFAYLGYPDAESFGDLNDSSVGGFYRGIDDPLAGNTLLNDDQYRLFIKAKIIKNSTNATPNQLLEFVKFVFDSPQNQIIEEGDAAYTLLVGKELSSFETVLLNYVSYSSGYPSRFVPKPIGVRVNYGSYVAGDAFAFQGVIGAKGYGDLTTLGLAGGWDLEFDLYFGGSVEGGYGLTYGISYGGPGAVVIGGGKYASLL